MSHLALLCLYGSPSAHLRIWERQETKYELNHYCTLRDCRGRGCSAVGFGQLPARVSGKPGHLNTFPTEMTSIRTTKPCVLSFDGKTRRTRSRSGKSSISDASRVLHLDAPKPIFGRREVSVACSQGRRNWCSSSEPNHAYRATNPPRERAVSAARAWLGRNLYRLELSLLQFSTEHRQTLGVAMACGQFLAVFHTVHLLSISYRKLVIFGGTD